MRRKGRWTTVNRNRPTELRCARPGTLAEIVSALAEFGARLEGISSRVTGIETSSAEVEPGSLFLALGGSRTHGMQHLDEAVRRGAVGVLHDTEQADLPLPAIRVADARAATGHLADLWYGQPSQNLWLAGVTGTNGKTTIVHLLTEAFAKLGEVPLRIGTLGMRCGKTVRDVQNTTPEALLLHRFLADAIKDGATRGSLEVSSHALDQQRVEGVAFDALAWTNLSQDHLDYHKDLDRYAAAKARLAHGADPGTPLLLPANDERIERACLGAPIEPIPWAIDGDAALRATYSPSSAGSGVQIAGVFGQAELLSPLRGRHNAENLLVAFGLLAASGVCAGDAATALSDVGGAPGRLEQIPDRSSRLLFVDYAHTPDALARVLAALREAFPGKRLGVVFGAGGDRDQAKRSAMGEAAAAGADWCLVTSDNPRTEDPARIAEEVAEGVRKAGGVVEIELDRREAIRAAVRRVDDGDLLLVAGKGHEPYQEVDGVRTPFDDRQELREAVRCCR